MREDMSKKLSIISVAILMIFASLGMTACKKTDDLTWTNDNAVYAYVKEGYEDDILEDVEGAFDSLSFQRVYITQKEVSGYTPLRLLFVLKENETTYKQEFMDILEQDERIRYVRECYDLPFEPIDTRCIEREKDTIAVGEAMTITYKGSFTAYTQQFDFGGLCVKPMTDKEYKAKDFPGIPVKSIEKIHGGLVYKDGWVYEDGWIYLELKRENYFDVIKALDILARMPTIQAVEPYSIITLPASLSSSSSWEVSDPTIVRLDIDFDDYRIAKIRGLKPGKVTVGLNGVECEITVTE